MSNPLTIGISSCYLDSPVGRIRISGTIAAITEVHFLEESDESGQDSDGDAAFDLIIECRNQLSAYFNGRCQQFNLPLAQAGTVFQKKVWQQLALIEYGNTISYLTLARQLGDPKVIRAAAAANGKNAIAVIVPCHRVIGTSGDLVGYAGGLHRKRWLLDHERRYAHGVRTLF